MLVIVPFALGRADIARPCAQLEHLALDLPIFPALAEGDVAGCIADVRAVEAKPDALVHIDRFGDARVRAAPAHLRAIHQVVHRIAERLIDVRGDVRVEGDHFANGHKASSFDQTCG